MVNRLADETPRRMNGAKRIIDKGQIMRTSAELVALGLKNSSKHRGRGLNE